jgi:hypothetical protein
MKRWAFIAIQSARLAILLSLTPILLGATAYRPGDAQLAFLSDPEKARQPATEAPAFPPLPDANAFDGRWIFTGAGCKGAGSVSAVIKGGTSPRTASSIQSAPATE